MGFEITLSFFLFRKGFFPSSAGTHFQSLSSTVHAAVGFPSRLRAFVLKIFWGLPLHLGIKSLNFFLSRKGASFSCLLV